MSLKFTRQKDRHFLLSLVYKIDKLLPLSSRLKLKLYLNLEWIFERMAHEKSFKVFRNHNIRNDSFKFIERFLLPTQTVLDVGCGSGELSHLLAQHTKHVLGIDHHSDTIHAARKRFSGSNLEFRFVDAQEFLTENKTHFDVLILSHVLEHLETPEIFLLNFKRFFDYIYLEVPDFDRTPLNSYRKEVDATLIYSDSDHIWEFDRKDMGELFHKSGLAVVESEFRFGTQQFWCKTS